MGVLRTIGQGIEQKLVGEEALLLIEAIRRSLRYRPQIPIQTKALVEIARLLARVAKPPPVLRCCFAPDRSDQDVWASWLLFPVHFDIDIWRESGTLHRHDLTLALAKSSSYGNALATATLLHRLSIDRDTSLIRQKEASIQKLWKTAHSVAMREDHADKPEVLTVRGCILLRLTFEWTYYSAKPGTLEKQAET